MVDAANTAVEAIHDALGRVEDCINTLIHNFIFHFSTKLNGAKVQTNFAYSAIG